MRIARLVLLTCLLALCSAGPRDRYLVVGVLQGEAPTPTPLPITTLKAAADLVLIADTDVYEDTDGTDPVEDTDFLNAWDDRTNLINFDGDVILTPTWSASAINGKPALVAGNNCHMESEANALNYTGSQPRSIFAVFKMTAATSDNNWLIDAKPGAGWGVGVFGDGKLDGYICSGASNCAEAKTNSATIADDTWVYAILTNSGARTAASWAIYVSTTSAQTLATVDDDNAADNAGTSTFGIGHRPGGSLQWGGGSIAEIIISPEVWDSTEIDVLDTYACTQYAIGC